MRAVWMERGVSSAGWRRFGEKSMRPETRAKYPEQWQRWSRLIILVRGNKCERCKLGPRPRKPLTVHHIDGNPENNSDGNLIVLCSPCHLRVQQQPWLSLHQLGTDGQLGLGT